MERWKIAAWAFILSLILCNFSVSAQTDKEEVIKVRTRVVFVDALVREKSGGASVGNLNKDNFEIFADGKRREISYFRRLGNEPRRPLALMLVLDLRYADVLNSLGDALKNLAPEDEVGVMVRVDGAGDPMTLLTDFTRDRARIADAFVKARDLPIAKKPIWYFDEIKSLLEKVEPAAALRPESQIVIVPVTNDVASLRNSERDDIASKLIRGIISFNPLIRTVDKVSVRMKNIPGKLPTPKPMLTTIGSMFGRDYYAPRHLAEQTGGDAIEIKRSDDYGAALQRLIEGLAARYDMGFELEENERDDGRMHKLEVKINAKDSRGKNRNLTVRSRRVFYVPKK